MKKLNNKIIVKATDKVKSKVSIDENLDKVKAVKFVSNKIEEIDKVINKFKLSF